ncbi:MAG: molybdate ABC transporter substrate-binding protein [Pseudomonadales bacterium]|nr:molybdate ABC transporter substrate-binding protein [Pseudomonadales bacterium]
MTRCLSVVLIVFSCQLHADEVSVAVAANFSVPMQKIAQEFEKESGHHVALSFGSTGNFYSQIKAGAPFELLLAADEKTPYRLEQEGLAVKGSRFTYATGTLVLWSALNGFVDNEGKVLQAGNFDHIALANPQLAPYGAAAIETLKSLGLLTRLMPKIVQGESIGQTYQFVATGNAQLGFVALSQVIGAHGQPKSGSMWTVPVTLHPPLRQDAVLLTKGSDQPAAQALLAFLKGPYALKVMQSFGYGSGH